MVIEINENKKLNKVVHNPKCLNFWNISINLNSLKISKVGEIRVTVFDLKNFYHYFLYYYYLKIIRGVIKNKTRLFSNFVGYVCSIFIFCLLYTHDFYMCWQYQPFWIVSLFLTDNEVCRILVCSSIFYYSKK